LYQNIFIKRTKRGNIVNLWDDQKGFSQFKFDRYCYQKDPDGEYTSIYGDKCRKVYEWAGVDESELFEHDVNLTTRVLVDLYQDSDIPSENHTVLTFDIEVEMITGLPDIREAQNEITSIAAQDSITKSYVVFVVDDKNEIDDNISDNREIRRFDNEHNMLLNFISYWEGVRPTIITGWNSDNFDVPYLYNRLVNVCGTTNANRLSEIGEVSYSTFKNKYQIAGVSSLDYMLLYKNFTYTQEASYSLDAISRKELGRGKIEYDGNLDELKRDDIEKFIEYNIVDVELVVGLDKKLQFIDLARGICHAGHVPYEEIVYSSKYLEGAVLTFLKSKRMVACNKMKNAQAKMKELKESGEKGFSGAFVKEPIAGKYNWIYDLDLTSLYPSIIMSLNISPETKLGRITNWDVETFVKGIDTEWKIGGNTWTDKKLRDTLEEMNISVASNGVMYRQDIRGCIPEILETWFDQRKEYQNKLEEYDKDSEEYKFFNRRQLIQKTLLNSLYGVLGLPVFRFYDVDNALAVTATGQDVILNSERVANLKYNREVEMTSGHVKYVDTDSLYIHVEPILKHRHSDYDEWDNERIAHEVFELAQEMQDHINEFYDQMSKRFFNVNKHRFEIKKETVARRAIFITKKRYAQWLIINKGKKTDELNVKGLDSVRSSYPKLFRSFMAEILTEILNDKSRESITDKIVIFKNHLYESSPSDVAKNSGLNKWDEYIVGDKNRLFEFKKSTPAHIKASFAYNTLLEHFNCAFKYEPIKQGDKIKWIYLKNNPYGLDAIAFKGNSDPVEIMDIINTYVDRDTMFKKELETKLQQFYDTLNWGKLISDETTADKFFSFN